MSGLLWWGAALVMGAFVAVAAQVALDVRREWRGRSGDHEVGRMDMTETREYGRRW